MMSKKEVESHMAGKYGIGGLDKIKGKPSKKIDKKKTMFGKGK